MKSSTSPRTLAVLGDVADAGVEALARASRRVTSSPPTRMRPARGAAQARERVDELASGRCRRRPRCRRSRPRAPRTRRRAPPRAPARRRREVLDRRAAARPARPASCRRAGGPRGRPSAGRGPPRVAPSRGTVSIVLPRRSTVIRSAISSTSFSLWVMKMIDFPSRLERAEDLEELARLLRRQHGGRLVEDEDLGAAVERLQDLDALLLPTLIDSTRASGRTARPNRSRELADALLGLAVVEERALASARPRARCSRPRSSPG